MKVISNITKHNIRNMYEAKICKTRTITCSDYVVYMWFTFGVHVVYMWCTCAVHGIYVHVVYIMIIECRKKKL